MAETIESLDSKIKTKSEIRLNLAIVDAFPGQNVFEESTQIDLSRVSTINGKYTISQLMAAIRSTCRALNRDSYHAKDVEDFVVKVDRLPPEDKP
jgi:hypothetical protein